MYKANIKLTEEQKQGFIIACLEQKETRIRQARKTKILAESKKQGNHKPTEAEEEKLKTWWRLEAEPLNAEEQKEMLSFERRLRIDMSYDFLYEDLDI